MGHRKVGPGGGALCLCNVASRSKVFGDGDKWRKETCAMVFFITFSVIGIDFLMKIRAMGVIFY